MAAHGLKVLSYSYKDMQLVTLNEMMHEHDIESNEFRQGIEQDLVYLCTFGIEDPLRESIHETVHVIKYGHAEGASCKDE
jgi:magnesium-transporting ATPase (P-type)